MYPYVLPLGGYDVPEELAERIAEDREGYRAGLHPLRSACAAYCTTRIGPPTTGSGGIDKEMLKCLLHVEEAEVTHALHVYDIEGYWPRFDGRFMILPVEGLAEKRPSVLIGDKVRVYASGTSEVSEALHLGYVHMCREREVCVSMNHQYIPMRSLDVQFTVNRVEFRSQHRAIEDTSVMLTENLCQQRPQAPSKMWQLPPTDAYFNSRAYNSLNEEQRAAVRGWLCSDSCPVLSLLWGPPGTGKTTTVVAYVLGLMKTAGVKDLVGNPSACVMVCTPSNSAADNVVLKLVRGGASPQHILRVMAHSRSTDVVPPSIRECCRTGDDGHEMPSPEDFKGVTVVVTTFGMAMRIRSCYPMLRCTHIVVDEAGQCTEALGCAAQQMCDIKTIQHIVLAGDPRQLPSVVHNPVARAYGFAISPLERLMAVPGGKACTTMLRVNYRSHGDILRLVNLFYEGLLRPPPVPGESRCRAVVAERLRLVHCDTPDEKRRDSPSRMNGGEVGHVRTMVEALVGRGEAPSSIVVLTPYALQRRVIREQLASRGLSNVAVYTIEQFQGGEACNVIISCVRSTADVSTLRGDIIRGLGFVKQRNRLNVAVSRAIDRLWIVGNMNVLAMDTESWCPLIAAMRALGVVMEGIGKVMTPGMLEPEAAGDSLDPRVLGFEGDEVLVTRIEH